MARERNRRGTAPRPEPDDDDQNLDGAPEPALPVPEVRRETEAESRLAEAVTITVEVTPPKPSDSKPHWVGLVPECRLQLATVGGVTFPKSTARLRAVDGSEGLMMADVPQVGAIVFLTPKQLKHLKDCMTRAGIRHGFKRHLGRDGEYQKVETAELASPRQSEDEPLAWYAWCREVSKDFRPDPGNAIPPTMAKRPEPKAEKVA